MRNERYPLEQQSIILSDVGLSILNVVSGISVFRYIYIGNPHYRISDIVKPIPILIGGENKMYNHEEMSCCGMYHPRMFLTKEEKIDHLNKYKTWLESETKGVNEAIAKLKES